jgi:hypothetical protein
VRAPTPVACAENVSVAGAFSTAHRMDAAALPEVELEPGCGEGELDGEGNGGDVCAVQTHVDRWLHRVDELVVGKGDVHGAASALESLFRVLAQSAYLDQAPAKMTTTLSCRKPQTCSATSPESCGQWELLIQVANFVLRTCEEKMYLEPVRRRNLCSHRFLNDNRIMACQIIFVLIRAKPWL